MNRHRYMSTDSSDERRARRNKIWIGCGVAFLVLVLVVAGISIWLSGRNKDKPSTRSERIDCHPDRPINETACLKRGCSFIPASDLQVQDSDLITSSFLGVPSCFFPKNYVGYEPSQVLQDEENANRITATLTRKRPSGFDGDVKYVELEVTPIDDNRLRIKIQDADKKQYIPEVPEIQLPETKPDGSENYQVKFTEGVLEITRKNKQSVIFRSDLTRLIFSEQFLQISSDLPSKFIYGLGEQKESVHKSTNWTRYTLFNQGDLPVPHRNLYGSHPFYLVMEPDGLSSGVFLLNTNAIDYVLQPDPAVTIRAVGGIFDFYVLLGPTPGEVVSQYTALFGRPNFPPRWSLGFQICKYGYFSLNKTKAVLERNLAAGIPIDVQWHDIDYMERHLDFTYDNTNFKGLPEFVEDLHKSGRHYIAMISPGVSNTEKPGTYKAYDIGKELDLFVKDASEEHYIEGKVWNENYTVFPDFSNSATEDYWEDRFRDFYSELHFDGVWIDMNEPLNFLNGSNEGCLETKYDNPQYLPGRPYPLNTLTLCMSARHKRTVHYNEHNLVAYREAKATHRAMRNITGKRPFIISRASFSGQAVYSGHWSGDITSNWEDMRYTIPAMLAFSLYGMPMTGSDICGFRLNTTEELCARWQALGAFYPMSRNHNDFDTIDQDPAAMGKIVVEATKKALKIRYFLLPYLYTLFYRNHVYGETVARPLFFEWPDDKNTYTIEEEFLWGPALLILPALHEGINSITSYVPKGTWYHLNTNERFESKGKNFVFEANITDINVLIRGGYILPAQDPKTTTTDSAKSPFTFLVALDDQGKAKGELFLDDGETWNTYEDGKYNLFEMVAEENSLKIQSKKSGYGMDMTLGHIKVYGLKRSPSKVTINGEEPKYIFKKGVLDIDGANKPLLPNVMVQWS